MVLKKSYFNIPTIIRNRANMLVIAIPTRKQFIFDEFGDFPVSMAIFKTSSSAAATTITSLRKESVKKIYKYSFT